MVEFKTNYGIRKIDPRLVHCVEVDGNLTSIAVREALSGTGCGITRYIVSDSYSEAMRKLGRNV